MEEIRKAVIQYERFLEMEKILAEAIIYLTKPELSIEVTFEDKQRKAEVVTAVTGRDIYAQLDDDDIGYHPILYFGNKRINMETYLSDIGVKDGDNIHEKYVIDVLTVRKGKKNRVHDEFFITDGAEYDVEYIIKTVSQSSGAYKIVLSRSHGYWYPSVDFECLKLKKMEDKYCVYDCDKVPHVEILVYNSCIKDALP